MADEQDKDQKTEDPTAKRLEEALKKGNVAFSREITSFLILCALALTVTWFASDILRNTRLLLVPFLSEAERFPTDSKALGEMLTHTAFGALAIIAAPLIATIIAAFASSFLQNGIIYSSEPLMPKLSKISPLAGLKRMFSMRSVIEFLKGIIKITIVAVVAFIAVYPQLAHIQQLPDSNTEAMLVFMAKLAMHLTFGVVIAMFFIAVLDLLYQRFQHIKSLRMSKQEIKDEYKQSEGDPMIKQRLRQLRQERAKQRMMTAVPKADVVITNPTHYAVALQYDTKVMQAPILVAKGQDLIALRIKELAEEHDVPIVENPPLARALFTSTDVNEEIPITHYEAVAKIISYVYQLKGKKL